MVMAALMALVMPSDARVLRNDPGGNIEQYQQAFADAKANHEFIAVDGGCASACTLIFTYPRELVCVTPRAWFGFHAAFKASEDEETGELVPAKTDKYGLPVSDVAATQAVFKQYPKAVQSWIEGHGGIMHPSIALDPYCVASRENDAAPESIICSALGSEIDQSRSVAVPRKADLIPQRASIFAQRLESCPAVPYAFDVEAAHV